MQVSLAGIMLLRAGHAKELSVDMSDKEKLDQDCMTKADDFAAEKKSRAEELKAPDLSESMASVTFASRV